MQRRGLLGACGPVAKYNMERLIGKLEQLLDMEDVWSRIGEWHGRVITLCKKVKRTYAGVRWRPMPPVVPAHIRCITVCDAFYGNGRIAQFLGLTVDTSDTDALMPALLMYKLHECMNGVRASMRSVPGLLTSLCLCETDVLSAVWCPCASAKPGEQYTRQMLVVCGQPFG